MQSGEYEALVADDDSHHQSFVDDEIEEAENVSDVMSPNRSTHQRLEPVGNNSEDKFAVRNIPGQENDVYIPSSKSRMNAKTPAKNSALDDLAHDISFEALQVAIAELSTDEETSHSRLASLLGHAAGDGMEQGLEASQVAGFKPLKQDTSASFNTHLRLSGASEGRDSGPKSFISPHNKEMVGNASNLTQYSRRESGESLLSQGEYSTNSNSQQMSTVMYLQDVSSPGRLSISQYPISDSSLGSCTKKEDSSVSQYGIGEESFTQQKTERVPKPVEKDLQEPIGGKSSISPDMAMYETRPGSVIERPETDGHNDQDNCKTNVSSVKVETSLPSYRVSDMESTKSSAYDYSIKLPRYNSIGDSVLSVNKQPLNSSTPNKPDEAVGTSSTAPLQKVPKSQYMSAEERTKMLENTFHSKMDNQDESAGKQNDEFTPSTVQKSLAEETKVSMSVPQEPTFDTQTDFSGRISDTRSLKSAGSLEQFAFDRASDNTSVWSGSARNSLERDGHVEERNAYKNKSASARTTPSSVSVDLEGILSMNRSPKEHLERLAAASTSPIHIPHLSRENASLDLYNKSGKKDSDSIASSVSSSTGSNPRSGFDNLFHYNGRDRHSSGSYASADFPTKLAISGHSEKSAGSNGSRESNRDSFKPLVPSESILYESSKLKERLSEGSNASSQNSIPFTLDELDNKNEMSKSTSRLEAGKAKESEKEKQQQMSLSIGGKFDMHKENSLEYGDEKRSSVESMESLKLPNRDMNTFYSLTPGAELLGMSEKSDSSKTSSGVANNLDKEATHGGSASSKVSLGDIQFVQKSQEHSRSSSERSKSSDSSKSLSRSVVENRKSSEAQSTETNDRNFDEYLKPTVLLEEDQGSSKRSSLGSEGSKRSSLSLGATAESYRSKPESLTDRVTAILKDQVDHDAHSEVDSDVERITGEYKAILQGVTAKLNAGESSENIKKLTDEALKSVKNTENVVNLKKNDGVENDEDPKQISGTDETLDQDVKRILAKYGRHLSDEQALAQINIPRGRHSPAASTGYDTDDTLSHRVQNILMKSADLGSTFGNSNSVPAYLYDDPARSMTLPTDLGSTNSSDDSLPTSDERKEASVRKTEEFRKPVDSSDDTKIPVTEKPQAVASIERDAISKDISAPKTKQQKEFASKQREDDTRKARGLSSASQQSSNSTDSLHKKVSKILTTTTHLGDGSDSSFPTSAVSSRTPSRASSVDYKALSDDLDELQIHLDTIKTVHEEHKSQNRSRRGVAMTENRNLAKSMESFDGTPTSAGNSLATSVSNSQYSTPKKYTWDHGADFGLNDEGRFVSASTAHMPSKRDSEDVMANKSPSQKTYYSMPISPLLTHGVVPLDVALDILHGQESEWKPQSVAEFDAMLEIKRKSPARVDDMKKAHEYTPMTYGDRSPAKRQLINEFGSGSEENSTQDRHSSSISSTPHRLSPSKSKPQAEQKSVVQEKDRRTKYVSSNSSYKGQDELSYKSRTDSERKVYKEERLERARFGQGDHSSAEESSVNKVGEYQREDFYNKETKQEDVYQSLQSPYNSDKYLYPEHPDEVARNRSTSDPPSMIESEDTDVAYGRLRERLTQEGLRSDKNDVHTSGDSTPTNLSEHSFTEETLELQAFEQTSSTKQSGGKFEPLKPQKETQFKEYQIEYDERGNRTHSPVNFEEANSTLTTQTPSDFKSQLDSFNMTPVAQKPLKAFGNMHSLFASQRDRASAAQFDESVELRSPMKHRLESGMSRESFQSSNYESRRNYPQDGGYSSESFQSNEQYSSFNPNPIRNSGMHPIQSGFSTESLQERTLTPMSRDTVPEESDSELKKSLTADQLLDKYSSREVDRYPAYSSRSDDQKLQANAHELNDNHSEKKRTERDGKKGNYDEYKNLKSSDRFVAHRRDDDSIRRNHVYKSNSRESLPKEFNQENNLQERGTIPREKSSDKLRSEPQSGELSTASRKSSSPNLRPYRPAGSSEVYYVEAGDDCNQSIATVETVESTHTGSDDARGPALPSHVYGTRQDPPNKALGVYGKQKSPRGVVQSQGLGTIPEQGSDSRDTDHRSSHSSKRSSDQSKKSLHKVEEEKERSFSKTRDWVNGNYPSKEDLREIDSPVPQYQEPLKDRGEVERKHSDDRWSNKKKSSDDLLRDEYQGLPNRRTSIEKVDSSSKELGSKEMESRSKHLESQYSRDDDRLNQRAAEIRRRFQDFADNQVASPLDIRDLRASASESLVDRKNYDQKFRTPKRSSNRNSPSLDNTATKTSSTSLVDSNLKAGTLRDTIRSTKPSTSPVDLHKLPSSYDIRNDRYNAASPSHQYMSDSLLESLTQPRSPKDAISLGRKKGTAGSGRSPSPSHSPERYDELDTITSFDKHYAKVDEYMGRSRSPPHASHKRSGLSPLHATQERNNFRTTPHPRDLLNDQGSPLLSDYEYQAYDDAGTYTGEDTGNTSSLMKYASSFVNSSVGAPLSSAKSPQSTRSYREMSSSPLDSSDQHAVSPDRAMDSMAASTISPYSNATDRFQHSQSPSRFSPKRPFDSRKYDRYGFKLPSPPEKRYEPSVDNKPPSGLRKEQVAKDSTNRSKMAETRDTEWRKAPQSPTIPDNIHEIWEKFKDHMHNHSSSSESVVGVGNVERMKKSSSASDYSEHRLDKQSTMKTPSTLSFGDLKTATFNTEKAQSAHTFGVSTDKAPSTLSFGDLRSVKQSTTSIRERDLTDYRTAMRDREQRSFERDMNSSSAERRDIGREFREQYRPVVHDDRQSNESVGKDRDRYDRATKEVPRGQNAIVKHLDEKERSFTKEALKDSSFREAHLNGSNSRIDVKNTSSKFEDSKPLRRNELSATIEPRNVGRELQSSAVERDFSTIHGSMRLPHSVFPHNNVPNPRTATHRDESNQNNESKGQQGRSDNQQQQNQQNQGNSGRESDPEQHDRVNRENSGNGGGRDPNDDPNKDDDKRQEERRKETTTEEEADDSSHHDENPPQPQPKMVDRGTQPRKMAWVIKDETLLSIPEDSTLDSVSSDFTTSSEIDETGKQITRTTKRQLPADPKLLKLQQKIARQKEKHRREWIREQKRKDKIKLLEELLIERGGGMVRYKKRQQIIESSTTFSSTLSDSGSLTYTDITETTLKETQNDTYDVAEVTQDSTLKDQSHIEDKRCTCHHKPHPAVKKSPKKKITVMSPKLSSIRKHSYHLHSSGSPKKQRVRNDQEPPFQTKEVDYQISDSKKKKHRATYMEFDKPESHHERKQRNRRDYDKENRLPSHIPSKRQESPTRNVGRQPRKEKKRDFGANFPSPAPPSPALPRGMVSEGIQTSLLPEVSHHLERHSYHDRSCPLRSGSGSPHRQSKSQSPHRSVSPHHRPKSKSPRRHHRSKSRSPDRKSPSRRRREENERHKNTSHGMFTPEDSDAENEPVRPVVPRPVVRPPEAWFVPLTDPQPWRKPLSEKQAYIDALATWPDKEAQQRKLQSLVYGITDDANDVRDEDIYRSNTSMTEREKPKSPGNAGTLQEAFLNRKSSFISKSRERQRVVHLRAEERRIQALHRLQRNRLFDVKRKKEANLHALPISEIHYKPIKRKFTKQEMKEQTERKYKQLPEVKQMAEEKKRAENFKTNRLKAQIFKQPAPFELRRYSHRGGSKKSAEQSVNKKGPNVATLAAPEEVVPKKTKKVLKKHKSAQKDVSRNENMNRNTNNNTCSASSVNPPKNALVVRNYGKPVDKEAGCKRSHQKSSLGDLSLAEALRRVGIQTYQAKDYHEDRQNTKGHTKSLFAAAERETITEVKTSYRFKFRTK